MKLYFNILFALCTILFYSDLDALNRDYKNNCDKDNSFRHYYEHYCIEHAPGECPDDIDCALLSLIPATGPKCRDCDEKSIYLGYLDPDFQKYKIHLSRQLEYINYNYYYNCTCYWPEYSYEASQISDLAYLLFRDMITSTKLLNLIKDEKEQKKFINNPGWFLNIHGLTISFIAQQFRFTDYYHVCQDIENYAKSNFNDQEYAKIKDKLEDILEVLYSKFIILYSSCNKKHPSYDIDQEIRFMKLLVNDSSGLEKFDLSEEDFLFSYTYNSSGNIEHILANIEKSNCQDVLMSKGTLSNNKAIEIDHCILNSSINYLADIPNNYSTNIFSQEALIFLEQGTLLNNLLLYKDAIYILTKAIKLNPFCREAYIERSIAYFETNQLSLALEDYERAKKLTIVPPLKSNSYNSMVMSSLFVPENKAEFSKGLLSGTTEGAKISAEEFIPSIFSCCRGILNGLWAFVCSPIEVSQEMINAAYAVGEFISVHSNQECFECVVPELKDISLTWHKINDYSKGKKIGFIIGKYGVDIFAPAGALKGVNKIKALKRANAMCTLESCISSPLKQAKILEESSKRLVFRTTLENTNRGKILTKSSNVQYHVMQKKHAWDKVLKLSGSVEEDFKNVTILLENNSILADKYLIISEKFADGKIIRADYKMVINGEEIMAIFEKYVETNQVYLKDAWVMTK